MTVTPPEAFGIATIKRIEWLTLVLGGLGTIWASWQWGWRGGLGLAIGAVLAWVNFRWLKGSVRAFGNVAVRQAAPDSSSSGTLGNQASPGTMSHESSQVSTQAPAQAPVASIVPVRVPVSAYLKFFGRFALLLGTVYVILSRSWLPAVAVFAGLFASAAAVVCGLVFELIATGVRQGTRSSS